MASENVLDLRPNRKTFPGAAPPGGAGFDLRRREAHVRVGGNGEDKSALMKIVSGAYAKTSSRMRLRRQTKA